MRRTTRGKSSLVITGVIAVVLAAGLVALVCSTVDGTEAKVAGIAAILGGIGSGYGGVAAAISAWRSREAAEASDAVASQVAQIARESRDALARAIKPRLEPYIPASYGSCSRVSIRNEAAWMARDVELKLELPTGKPLTDGAVDTVPSADWDRSGVEVAIVPVIPRSIEEHAISRSTHDGHTVRVVEGTMTMRFSDAEKLRTYVSEYTLTLTVGWEYIEEIVPRLVSSRPVEP